MITYRTPEKILMLAPMAGVTDMPFRVLCLEAGCTHVITEMVSAKGWLQSSASSKAHQLLVKIDDSEKHRASLQIFGHNPDEMYEVAKQVTKESGFAYLDINMGCPVPKIVNHGDGSALLRNAPLAKEVMEAVVKGSPVPVSIKLRKGFDESNPSIYLRIAEIAQSVGVSLITLHARLRSEYYSGLADWDAITRLKHTVTIPVIGNGDIRCANDALRMLDETGCDGVAVGRSAQGNPWIFTQIANLLHGNPAQVISNTERFRVFSRHLNMLVDYKGERMAVLEMRRHASAYISGMRNATCMREQINRIISAAEFKLLMEQFLLNNGGTL